MGGPMPILNAGIKNSMVRWRYPGLTDYAAIFFLVAEDDYLFSCKKQSILGEFQVGRLLP